MDKIFARVVIRLAAHIVPDQSAGLWKPGVRSFFPTSADAMWAVCPGHRRRVGNTT